MPAGTCRKCWQSQATICESYWCHCCIVMLQTEALPAVQLFFTLCSSVAGTTSAMACNSELASRSAKVCLACWWNAIMRFPNCLCAKALFASTPAALRISVFTLFNPPLRSPSNTLMAEICNDVHCQHSTTYRFPGYRIEPLADVMLRLTVACNSSTST